VVGERQGHAVPARAGLRSDGPAELQRLVLAAGEGGKRERAVRLEPAAQRLGDRRELVDQRGRGRQLAGEEEEIHAGVERERQQRQRARLARERDVPIGQLLPALVVPQISSGVGGQPHPAIRIGHRQLPGPEGANGSLQQRRPSAIPVRDHHRQRIEEQVLRTGRVRGRGARGLSDLQQAGLTGQASHEQRRRQRVQIRVTRRRRVRRL
jgi:hypothetical protein